MTMDDYVEDSEWGMRTNSRFGFVGLRRQVEYNHGGDPGRTKIYTVYSLKRTITISVRCPLPRH